MATKSGETSHPTIWDVAREAGVSQTAVSLALRGVPGVSEKRAADIRRIAQGMNYQPKIAAQMMRAKKVRQLGLIVPCEDAGNLAHSGHGMPIMVHFVDQCDQRSLRYHIEFIKSDPNEPFTLPVQLAGQMVDGVVLAGFVNEQLQDWLKNQTQYPWVNVDEPSDYCALSAMDVGLHEAVQYIAAMGHHRVAYLGGPLKYKSQQLGREGVEKAIEEFSLSQIAGPEVDYEQVHTTRDWMGQSVVWATHLLNLPVRPTAIVCQGVVTARAVIHVANQLGLSVPSDLSIIAVGPANFAESTLPFITTVEQDFKGLVKSALDILGARISKRESIMPQTQWIRPKLVVRDSVVLAPAN